MKKISKALVAFLIGACVFGLPACCHKQDKQPPPAKVATPKAEVLPAP